MPKKAKKKATKKDKSTTKQRQAVNVKIKIDQSRRTNPREPRAVAKPSSGLPSRTYTANSSTPLHTTIMTATPTPTVIQKEPNYAEVVKDLFQDAERKQRNQLALLSENIERRDNQINQLVQQQKLPQTKELYNLLMKEHQARLTGNADVEEMPDEAETEGVDAFNPPPPKQSEFNDPNAKVENKLTTPVAQRTKAKTAQPIVLQLQPVKRPRGRPRKQPIVETEIIDVLPEEKKEEEKTPKITKYFKTRKQEQEELEDQRNIDELSKKLTEKAKAKTKSKKKKKQSEEEASGPMMAGLFAGGSDY